MEKERSMSEQEMQFADPEWQPPGLASQPVHEAARPQPVNEPARGATGTMDEDASSDYERGYRAQKPLDDTYYQEDEREQQFRQQPGYQAPPRRRSTWRRPWLWILLILIIASLPFDGEEALFLSRDILLGLIIGGMIAASIFFINRGRRAPAPDVVETHTYAVGVQPRIVIRNNVGAVRVRSDGEQNEVTVRVTRHTGGWFGAVGTASVSYDQNIEKNRVTVKADSGWSILGKRSVDFDITVPRLADLDLKTDAGSVSVVGVSGQMTLSSNAGSVAASQVMLRGDSKLKTDAGSVTFSGALDPFGSYLLSTDAGGITVLLPEDASFQLDARTDVGSIRSDFVLATRLVFPGAKARCDVGSPPYPRLKLRTDVGSINIRRS